MGLARPDSLASYAALLCILWGFQAPLERLLGHQELPSAVGWPARQRLGALAADLTDLGVTGASLPEATGFPTLAAPGGCGEFCTSPKGQPWAAGYCGVASKATSVRCRYGSSTATAAALSRCGVT